MANIRPAVAITIFLLGFGPAAHGASFVRVVSSRTRTSAVNSSMAGTVGSGGVAGGDSVVVTVNVGSLGGAVACSDSINGAYNTDVVSLGLACIFTASHDTPRKRLIARSIGANPKRLSAGAAAIAIASKHNVSALGFGDVITCTYPAFNGASSMTVYEFSGLEGANPLDQTAQSLSASAGAASSGLTAATSQARDLCLSLQRAFVGPRALQRLRADEAALLPPAELRVALGLAWAAGDLSLVRAKSDTQPRALVEDRLQHRFERPGRSDRGRSRPVGVLRRHTVTAERVSG